MTNRSNSRAIALGHHEGRGEPSSRFGVPSWVGSVAFHVVLLGVVLLLWSMAPKRPQAPGERTADDVGIVLAHDASDDEKTFFETEENSQDQQDPSSSATSQNTLNVRDIPNETPPNDFDPNVYLPEDLVIGVHPPDSEGGDPTDNLGGTGDGHKGDGTAGEFIGLRGGGPGGGDAHSFVYVIDRSDSMGDWNSSPLRLAKNELIHSIESLQDNHQFQIIFFNEEPAVFNPAGGSRLAWATDQNKRVASNFVASIRPGGGTNHEEALMRAIALQPDVIFFLTDAGEPQMSSAALNRIQRKAAGSISVIEFGKGPDPETNNFLRTLARQNRGQYGYVDITKHLQR